MNSIRKASRQDKDKSIAELIEKKEAVWVGMDVHKRNWNVAIYSAAQNRIVKEWHMDANLEGLLKVLDPIRSNIRRIGYEAGPTGFGLARFLKANELPVIVLSAADIPMPRSKHAKSDRLDAANLAIKLIDPRLRPVYIPSVEEEDARSTFRNRDQLADKIRRVKAQIKSHLLCWGQPEPKGLDQWSRASIKALSQCPLPENAKAQLDTYLLELEHLEKLRKEATQRLKKCTQERFGETNRNLKSVPGVGPVTAAGFLLELPQLPHIQNRKQLAQLIGLSPLRRGSGETDRECGRYPGGKKHLRHLLIEAAWVWVRRDSQARVIYERIRGGKDNRKKKAIVAMARHLAIILWHIYREGRPYRPMTQTADTQSPDTQTLDSQTPDTQTFDSQALNAHA